MDPLTAVGFAANILQFIDFSWKLVQSSYEVYHSATGTTAENAHIGNVINDLQEVTEGLHCDFKAGSKRERELLKISNSCLDLSRDLSRILGKLKAKENSRWQSLKTTWASIRKEKAVASIEKRLGDYRMQIILHLNWIMCGQQSSVRQKLDQIQQEGLKLSSESAKQMAELRGHLKRTIQELRATATTTNQLNDGSDAYSLAEVCHTLIKLDNIRNSLPRENIVLRRLYFDAMHRREDAVSDVETGSFAWILEEEIEPKENTVKGLIEYGNDEDKDEDGAVSSSSQSTSIRSSLNKPTAFEEDEGCTHSQEVVNVDPDDKDKSSDNRESESTANYIAPSYFMSDALDSERETRSRTSEALISFLRNDNGVFFICGKAGSGKSTMMKFLFGHQRVRQELETWAGDKKLVFVNFFFWNSGDELQMSLEGFYRSLLFETFKQCPELISQVFPDKSMAFHPFSMQSPFRLPELKVAFEKLTKTTCFPNHRFCYFIDGLDEYKGGRDDNSLEHFDLARRLKSWAASDDVKIVCSARPHTAFLDIFKEPGRTIHLHELISHDIHQFALAQFAEALKDSRFDVARQRYIDLARKIALMAEGVFLWARLVVRSLLTGILHHDSPKALEKRLEETPKELDDFFTQMLKSVDQAVEKRSYQMLLLAAKSPFYRSLNGPLNALAFSWLDNLEDENFPFNRPFQAYSNDEVEKRLQDVRHQLDVLTKGLLEMGTFPDENDPACKYHVQFFHRTVRDYLQREWNWKNKPVRCGAFDPENPETYFRIMLTQLTFGIKIVPNRGFLSDSSYLSALPWAFVGHSFPFRYVEGLRRTVNSMVLYHKAPLLLIATEIRSDASRRGTYFFDDVSFSDISFLTFAAQAGQDSYVLRKLSDSDYSLRPEEEEFLLLNALVIHPHPDLIQYFFDKGVSADTPIKIETKKEKAVSIWLIFLSLSLGGYLSISRSPPKPSTFVILEKFLRNGADRDVIFLVSKEVPNTDGAFATDSPPTIESFYIELHQVVEYFQPPNLEAIRKLLKDDGGSSPFWSRARESLLTVLTFNTERTRTTSIRSNYKPADINMLDERRFWIDRVVSNTCELSGWFRIDYSKLFQICSRSPRIRIKYDGSWA